MSDCDREASIMRPWPTGGCCKMGEAWKLQMFVYDCCNYVQIKFWKACYYLVENRVSFRLFKILEIMSCMGLKLGI